MGFGGKLYRKTIAKYARPISQQIGDYGPFKFNAHFSFSNFGNWGQMHNDCFDSCIKSCEGKKVVFDIGAHIGLVTMPMASVLSPGGKVYAFEPAFGNRKFLQEHVRINDLAGKVIVEPFLVGDSETEDQKFYEAGTDSGMNSITPIGKGEEISATSKKQVTIDSYCFENQIFPTRIGHESYTYFQKHKNKHFEKCLSRKRLNCFRREMSTTTKESLSLSN